MLAATTKVGGWAGQLRTAMATLLARNKPEGLDVVILVRSEKDADAINDTTGTLASRVRAPRSFRDTILRRVAGADFIHAPVQSSKAFLAGVKDHIDPATPSCSPRAPWHAR